MQSAARTATHDGGQGSEGGQILAQAHRDRRNHFPDERRSASTPAAQVLSRGSHGENIRQTRVRHLSSHHCDGGLAAHLQPPFSAFVHDRLAILETIGISKSFPGVKALQNVDFSLFPGEIHTLMGQNGAGKSTLINVLTGVHTHDAGEIRLAGEVVNFATPLHAEAAGIRTLYQEVNLCPNLSVAENVFAGRQPKRHGAIDWKTIHARAEAALAELNVSLDVTKSLDTYPIAVQQMVAIARSVSVDARVLILDEPTSSLDDSEVARLFDVLRKLKQSDIAILFVTHFLEQTYAISDRITVMRNGEREGEYACSELSRLALVNKMVGATVDASAAAAELAAAVAANTDGDLRCATGDDAASTRGDSKAAQSAPAFLQARGLGRKGALAPLDIDLHCGELLGLCGLLGSGRTETARLLFGADKADSGSISIAGRVRNFSSPRDAIAAGIGFCSEDRKHEGAILELSVRENVILALQAKRGMLRAIPFKQQQALARDYVKWLGVKTPTIETSIGSLSGGNQQ